MVALTGGVKSGVVCFSRICSKSAFRRQGTCLSSSRLLTLAPGSTHNSWSTIKQKWLHNCVSLLILFIFYVCYLKLHTSFLCLVLAITQKISIVFTFTVWLKQNSSWTREWNLIKTLCNLQWKRTYLYITWLDNRNTVSIVM